MSRPIKGGGSEEHAADTEVEGHAGHDDEGPVQAAVGQRQADKRRQDEGTDATSGKAHTDGKGAFLLEVLTDDDDTGRVGETAADTFEEEFNVSNSSV